MEGLEGGGDIAALFFSIPKLFIGGPWRLSTHWRQGSSQSWGVFISRPAGPAAKQSPAPGVCAF
jgi:hypothetical protein